MLPCSKRQEQWKIDTYKHTKRKEYKSRNICQSLLCRYTEWKVQAHRQIKSLYVWGGCRKKCPEPLIISIKLWGVHLNLASKSFNCNWFSVTHRYTVADILEERYSFIRVVLVHDTGSNDARFMYNLCLYLHALNIVMGRGNLHLMEK